MAHLRQNRMSPSCAAYARENVYSANADVVKAVQWVSCWRRRCFDQVCHNSMNSLETENSSVYAGVRLPPLVSQSRH